MNHNISATEPDWHREKIEKWWTPSKQLLKSIREYQKWQSSNFPLKSKEELNFADGEEIVISINDYRLQKSKSSITWDDFKEVIGAWAEDDNTTSIFNEIDKQRHEDFGREVNL